MIDSQFEIILHIMAGWINSFMEEDNYYPIIPRWNNTFSGNALHNEIPFHDQERLEKKKRKRT